VNVSFSAAPQNIVNHFNLSTIKKRIIMMNAKRSSKVTLTRYAFLVPVVIVCLLSFSISKAELIKKSKSAYKSISGSVDKINSIAKTGIINTVDHNVAKMTTTLVNYITHPRDTAKLTAVRVINFTDSNTRYKDTSLRIAHRTMNLITSTDTNPKKIIAHLSVSGSNQPLYIIDGRVAKTESLSSLSPDNIERIEVDRTPANLRSVLYITTKTNADPGRINAVSVNGKTIMMDKTTTINGLNAIIDTLKIDKNPKMVNGHVVVDTIYLRRHPEEVIVQGYATPRGGTDKVTLSSSSQSAFAKDALAANGKLNKSGPVIVTDIPLNQESSINHIGDKLIVINGKEASVSDMKKLSAFDIERMVLKTDAETKSLYGDKAKNGILFIVTKKNNNK
jgi:bla regulator protein BlaR1